MSVNSPPVAERAATTKLTPFIKFSKEQRPKVIAANPGIAFGDVGRKIGEAWRKLSDAQKAKYA